MIPAAALLASTLTGCGDPCAGTEFSEAAKKAASEGYEVEAEDGCELAPGETKANLDN